MNVTELYELTLWIDREIEQTDIPIKYQKLQNVLHINSQQNQRKQSIEQQKDDLVSSLKEITISTLSKEQLSFLDNLGILDKLGISGVERIEDVIYKNVIDEVTAAKKIQDMVLELNYGIEKSNKIYSGLEDVIISEEYEEKNEVIVRVNFSGDASISDVTKFKEWGRAWFDIGRGISMAHNLSPKDVRIVGATKGSIILELAVVASIATTVSGILLAGLKVAEKILDIQKKAEEVKGLKLQNKKIASDLEKEASKERTKGVEAIISQFVKSLNLNPVEEGDKVTALEKSVKTLINFLENGGDLDFLIPEEEEMEDKLVHQQLTEVRNIRREIYQIEKKVKLLK